MYKVYYYVYDCIKFQKQSKFLPLKQSFKLCKTTYNGYHRMMNFDFPTINLLVSRYFYSIISTLINDD